MKIRDFVVSIILMGLSFATWLEMKRSNLAIGTASAPQVGFFPLLIIIALVALSLILLVKAVKGGSEKLAPSWVGTGGLGPLMLTVGALFVFGIFFEFIGDLISVFLLVAFFLGVIGKKGVCLTVALALITTVAFYLLFDVLLKATLPVGILGGLLRR